MSFTLSLVLLAAAPPAETVEVTTESVEITVESAEELPLPDCLALPCPDDSRTQYAAPDDALDDWQYEPEGPALYDDYQAERKSNEQREAEREKEKKRRNRELELEGAYFGMGLGPMATFVPTGFYPGARYEAELGFVVEPVDLDRRGLWVGAHGYVDHYFGRKRVAGGLDIVLTKQFGPMYVRGGFGTAAALPRYNAGDPLSPGAGATVGFGLMGGDEIYGRVGVDYNVRVAQEFEVSHTVIVNLTLAFGP